MVLGLADGMVTKVGPILDDLLHINQKQFPDGWELTNSGDPDPCSVGGTPNVDVRCLMSKRNK